MYIFTALYLLVGNRTQLGSGSNRDPELITDPDPNLQIISDPSGSGCTTQLKIKDSVTIYRM
jgi:hypothetical protein